MGLLIRGTRRPQRPERPNRRSAPQPPQRALCGLIVVAASINIAKLIGMPHVIARLAASLVLFGAIFIVGTVLLVPGVGGTTVGAALTVLAVAVAAAVLLLGRGRSVPAAYRAYSRAAVGLQIVAVLPLLVAGVGCLVGAGGGLYWLAPAAVLTFVVGVSNSWVALVEVLR